LTAGARRDRVGDVRIFIAMLWCAAAWAQTPFDGTWEVPDPGRASGLLIELKTDGGRLTGSFAGPNGKIEIRNGSVAGETVSFETVMTLQGRSMTTRFTGRVVNGELVLTGEMPGIEQKMVAKRRAADAGAVDWFSAADAPTDVAAWLKANAIPLDDLAGLKARVKDARFVAMGEATHATHEFQAIKARVFRMLVEELGFTVFAIESPWATSVDADDYVQGRSDDLDAAVRHGYNWWRTEEFADLLRWMRSYNLDPAHTKKLKFVGFDIRGLTVLRPLVLDYLERAEPARRAEASRLLAELGPYDEFPEYTRASEEVHRRVAGGIAALLRRFDEAKAEYVARTSAAEWDVARHALEVVQQGEYKARVTDREGLEPRDRAMAGNMKWIVEHEPAGTKFMLWAHNGHVSAESNETVNMGSLLRREYGGEMAICGFVFGEGSFRAIDGGERTFTVGPPPRGSLDATLGGVGRSVFAVDVREAKGVVAEWLAAPHLSRQIGGGYSEATAPIYWHKVRASAAFDVLIFVAKTTGTRPR
jgi:erythromycin esterase